MATLVEQRDRVALPPATAVCLGAFDGLHLGHQALITRAQTLGERVGLVTFDPHPRQVLTPDRAPRLLHTDEQRRRVSASLGVDHVVLLPFDDAMAQMPADVFVKELLIEGLRPCAVVVGEDFRFGRGREGTAAMLSELLAPAEIKVVIVPPVPVPASARPPHADPHLKLGATAIRDAVAAGEIGRAADMLGRWHSVAGTVVKGAQRGRKIGFPTANVDAPSAFLPPAGVYASYLSVWSEGSPLYGKVWPAATNLGRNPTFVSSEDGSAELRLESHVIDKHLETELYGLAVEVHFVARIRDEQRFDETEALVAQLHDDVDICRYALGAAALARVVGPPKVPA